MRFIFGLKPRNHNNAAATSYVLYDDDAVPGNKPFDN